MNCMSKTFIKINSLSNIIYSLHTKIVNIFNRFDRNKMERTKISYSQCGEDIIVSYVLDCIGIKKPSYIDIGAHHPIYINNTYLFYRKGSSGVCIEPDAALYKEILKKRPRDMCLNIGITTQNNKIANFYMMNEKSLSTFSRVEAMRLEKMVNKKIVSIKRIPVHTVNDIIKNNFNKTPNILSIDIEGLDLLVLKSLDFKLYKPEVVVAETLTYSEDKKEAKIKPISEYMKTRGYFAYADTYINTIYVNEEAWRNRKF